MRLNQAVRNVALAAMPILFLLGIAGCKCGERATSSQEEMPPDLSIIFGQQGTFAGRSMGYSIDRNGRVAKWEGKYPGEIEQAVATVDVSQVRRLWQRAEEIGFLRMREQAMSTEALFITVSAEGESRRVTWVPRSDDVPTPVAEFYDECMEVARTALGERRAGESR